MENELDEKVEESMPSDDKDPMYWLRCEEHFHFTKFKVLFIGTCFLSLYLTQQYFGSKS